MSEYDEQTGMTREQMEEELRRIEVYESGKEWVRLEGWVEGRAADLKRHQWGDALIDASVNWEANEYTGDYPYSLAVRVDDVAEKQARAERWAYMRGEPIPDPDVALAELIEWIRNNGERAADEGTPSLTLPSFDLGGRLVARS
jgi:hypothetical protein